MEEDRAWSSPSPGRLALGDPDRCLTKDEFGSEQHSVDLESHKGAQAEGKRPGFTPKLRGLEARVSSL